MIADAPNAVAMLEKLIVMYFISREWIFDSTLKVYLLANTNSSSYLKNFQTNLLQIGHQGYSALLNANVNIDKIWMYDLKVSSHIKNAVRYPMSRNDYYITNLLPITMGLIEEAVDRNKGVAQSEFQIQSVNRTDSRNYLLGISYQTYQRKWVGEGPTGFEIALWASEDTARCGKNQRIKRRQRKLPGSYKSPARRKTRVGKFEKRLD